jgi:hypothetical protein
VLQETRANGLAVLTAGAAASPSSDAPSPPSATEAVANMAVAARASVRGGLRHERRDRAPHTQRLRLAQHHNTGTRSMHTQHAHTRRHEG